MNAPEKILEGKNRPFTGKEYIKSLQDEREIYIYGKRVSDVTQHPAFRNSVYSIVLHFGQCSQINHPSIWRLSSFAFRSANRSAKLITLLIQTPSASWKVFLHQMV